MLSRDNIRCHRVCLSIFFAGCSLWGFSAAADTTINPSGQVGLTNYSGFPFGSAIYENSWGSVNAQPGNLPYSPANLFWSHGSFYKNASYKAGAQAAAATLALRGIVPSGTAQRWEDTFEASEAASAFVGEPAWIATDRANYGSPIPNIPEYQAWVAWNNARPGLQAIASDGGSMGQDFRPWHGTWGQISPMMPMAGADCPTDMSTCTYGDWYANQWSQTSGFSGAYGLVLSDFANSLPSQPSWLQDFNQTIINDFKEKKAAAVPYGTVSQQASFITTHFFSLWNDYIATGYTNFFAALSSRISTATGKQALIVAGAFDWPGLNRSWGVDERIMAQRHGLAKHLLVVWDSITLQTDRDGANIVQGIAGSVISAAREPCIRNGAYLSANDGSFAAAVAKFNPALTPLAQSEWGTKQLKRQWLEFAWAHIGTREGKVRRALAFAWRDHWDAGTVDPTTTTLIQKINPTRPFGFGLYYSVAVERAIEASVPAKLDAYLSPVDLLALRQAIPLNYYISDASLPKLQTEQAPAAWIVLDAGSLLPSAELAALTKLAPVFTSVTAAAAFANAPLAFSGGLTGTGFYDQYGRIIITATNPSTSASAGTVNGAIILRALKLGMHTMTNLYTNGVTNITVTASSTTVPVSISRWDTMAWAISP